MVVVAFVSAAAVELLLGRGDERWRWLTLEQVLVVGLLGIVAAGVSLVLNLGRAPSSLLVDSDGLRLVLDGHPFRCLWDEIERIEFPRKGAWAIALKNGRSIEIWPYAYSPSRRRTLQAGLVRYLGESSEGRVANPAR